MREVADQLLVGLRLVEQRAPRGPAAAAARSRSSSISTTLAGAVGLRRRSRAPAAARAPAALAAQRRSALVANSLLRAAASVSRSSWRVRRTSRANGWPRTAARATAEQRSRARRWRTGTAPSASTTRHQRGQQVEACEARVAIAGAGRARARPAARCTGCDATRQLAELALERGDVASRCARCSAFSRCHAVEVLLVVALVARRSGSPLLYSLLQLGQRASPRLAARPRGSRGASPSRALLRRPRRPAGSSAGAGAGRGAVGAPACRRARVPARIVMRRHVASACSPWLWPAFVYACRAVGARADDLRLARARSGRQQAAPGDQDEHATE